MGWIKAIWAEVLGLFVDDGSLAVVVLMWLAICWALLPRLGLSPVWPPALLFVGLVLILSESAVSRARQRPLSTFSTPLGS